MKKKRSNKLLNIVILIILIIIVIVILYYHIVSKDYVILKDKYGKKIKFQKNKFQKNLKKKKNKIIVIQDGAYNKFPEYSEYSIKINKLYYFNYKILEHGIIIVKTLIY